MQAGLLLSIKNSITEDLRYLWRADQAIPWATACRTVLAFWTTYRGSLLSGNKLGRVETKCKGTELRHLI